MSQGYCTNCGAALMQGSAFCSGCGAPTAGPAQPEAVPYGHQPAAPPPQVPPAAQAPMMPAQAQPPTTLPAAPAAYAQPQPAKQSNLLRWVIIFIGAGMVLVGLARMMNGLGTMAGGARTPTASERTDADRAASRIILLGTWAPSDSAGCAVWLRFHDNQTLSDNAGNTGTWSYRPRDASSGTLTMSINNMPARSGELTQTGMDQFTLGGQSWRRTTC